MRDLTDIERDAYVSLCQGDFNRVIKLLGKLTRPLTINEAAYLGSARMFTSDLESAIALLQQAADAGNYLAARNLVSLRSDQSLPTYSIVDAEKYRRHAKSLWQAPWKTFMGMAAERLRPFGFRKQGKFLWRRLNSLQVVEVRRSQWNCDFDIRLGRANASAPIPKNIEECDDHLVLGEISSDGEMWYYNCEFQKPEIRLDEMNCLLDVIVTRALPWFQNET
jgi:hypothetical protein